MSSATAAAASSSSSSSIIASINFHTYDNAAKIAAIAPNYPAHPTSLGMQVLVDEKFRMRMRVPQQEQKQKSKSNAKSKSSTKKKKKGSKEVVVSALGWILNEWLEVLESRSRGGNNANAASPAYLIRLRGIVNELLADPDPHRSPEIALAVHDAGTAIPDNDLDPIINRIPNPVPPDSALLHSEYLDEGDADETLTPAQRVEEEKMIEILRSRSEAARASGTPIENFLTDEYLAAARLLPVPP